MADPEFLDYEDALRIHADQIERYGGKPGLRDRGLLESALAQPKATFDGAWLHRDIADMAAAYLYHIVKNHPFIDGNKRTGAACAVIFLDLNGLCLDIPWQDLADLVLGTASGTREKSQIADFLRRGCTKPPQ